MIIELNIRHYRECLTVEADPSARQMIVMLLAEEEGKLGRQSRDEARQGA